MNDSRRQDYQQLVRRIRSEFLDMPGLRLTCAQAQRLFGIGEEACRPVLETLVADDFLARNESGLYAMLPGRHAAVHGRPRGTHGPPLERTA